MGITIIGNGNMAKGLTACFLNGGQSVDLHCRDTSKGEALKDELAARAKDGASLIVKQIGSELGDIVIPTVHYGTEMEDVANTYGDAVSAKIVVDISNPVDFNTFQLIPEAGVSGAEEVARLFPKAKIVKAFNTVFAGALMAGKAGGLPIDVFIAGDDQDAKQTVSKVIANSGMRPLDVGPLANSRHLEGFELLHMSLQDQVNGNWMSGIKIVS